MLEVDVVVLCGGRGRRAWPMTTELPKALLPLGSKPLIEHVLGALQTRPSRVLLAAGHQIERLREWAASSTTGRDFELVVVDTGSDRGTAARIIDVARDIMTTRFVVMYCDGLANIDPAKLVESHDRAGLDATITTVPMPCPYGTVAVGLSGLVTGFREKPTLYDYRINAGYFVFESSLFGRGHPAIDNAQDLEREVLPRLAAARRLHAYNFEGFWSSIDTMKDVEEADALASQPTPPWRQPLMRRDALAAGAPEVGGTCASQGREH